MPKKGQSVVGGFLPSRVDRMINYLREHRHRIEDVSEKGKVTFDYKGSTITARHEDVQEKI